MIFTNDLGMDTLTFQEGLPITVGLMILYSYLDKLKTSIRYERIHTMSSVRSTLFGLVLLLLWTITPAQTQSTTESPQDPVVRRARAPDYPELAIRARIEGDVRVKVTVDGLGQVILARLVQGHPLLSSAALAAAEEWKFNPAAQADRSTILTFSFHHTPTESDDPLGTRKFIPPYQMVVKPPWLLPLEKTGLSKSRGTVCEVHEVPLKVDVVPIRYGLIEFNRKYRKISQKLFPNANDWWGGGCMLLPFTKAEVTYCEKCRVAKLAWLEKHR